MYAKTVRHSDRKGHREKNNIEIQIEMKDLLMLRFFYVFFFLFCFLLLFYFQIFFSRIYLRLGKIVDSNGPFFALSVFVESALRILPCFFSSNDALDLDSLSVHLLWYLKLVKRIALLSVCDWWSLHIRIQAHQTI